VKLLTSILVLAASSCALFQPPAATPPLPWPKLEASDFGAMRNVSKCGEVWFGGGLTADDVKLAQRRGVKSILDLSFSGEDLGFDLGRMCADLGIALYDPNLIAPDALTDRNADIALDLFRDPARKPLLVACSSGSNGAMYFALWRALDHDMPLEEALEEARRSGMRPGPLETYVQGQAERLTPRGE
jgi:hypothetical protein